MESSLAVKAEGTFTWDRGFDTHLRAVARKEIGKDQRSRDTRTSGVPFHPFYPFSPSTAPLICSGDLWRWWWTFEAPVYDPGFVQAGDGTQE